MKTKRIFSLLLCLIIFVISLSSAFSVSAANAKAEISFETKKFSVSDKKYVASSEFSLEVAAEKTVYVPVSVKTTSTVGGFGFTIDYDKNILEFDKEASFLVISDNKGSLSAHNTEKGVAVLWETYSSSTYINGEFYYAAFKIKDGINENKTTKVTLGIKQIYDGTKKQVNITAKITNKEAQINIKSSILTEAEIAPYKKLENIKYPDSAADITAAKEAFASLSAIKREQLKNDYPKLYEYYSTAQSRYNRLAEAAAEKAINDELNAYLKKHAGVFKLTPEKVKISDKAMVKEAINESKTLSTRAYEKLGKDKKDLLDALLKAIEEAEEIAEELKEFNASYGSHKNLTEKDIALDAENYILMLDEALMVYDTLSDGAKEQLSAWKKNVDKMKAIAQKYVDSDKAAAAIGEKVNAFQAKWMDVLLINSFNVSLGDETAIKIMLKDYEAQEKEVKQVLSSKMEGFKNLLDIIEGMKKIDGGDNQTSSTPSSSASSSEGSSSQGGGGTTIVQLPGETVVSTVTETVVEEKVTTNEKISFMQKSNKWLIIGLIILLIISIISFLMPFILGLIPKKTKKEENELIEEEIE
ncbi:MAG: hypothetical protein IJP22_01580 [Clostridia bacterium]|nr:hypothetical protein [Clostridia bacterium]